MTKQSRSPQRVAKLLKQVADEPPAVALKRIEEETDLVSRIAEKRDEIPARRELESVFTMKQSDPGEFGDFNIDSLRTNYESFSEGRVEVSARDYARIATGSDLVTIESKLGQRTQQLLHTDPDRQHLQLAFDEKFTGFRDDKLNKRYLAYRANNPEISPIAWARLTRGQSRALLKLKLGENFVRLLDRVFPGYLPRPVTPAVVQILHVYNWKIYDFETVRIAMRQLASEAGVKHIGWILEGDHLCERRFLRAFLNPTQMEQRLVNDLGNRTATLVVPRDADVASQLQALDPSLTFPYIHQTKTQLMHQLIPHGYEGYYTVQQVYDATIFAFKHLGLDQKLVNKIADENELVFAMLGIATGQNLTRRTTQIAAQFHPNAGWPDPKGAGKLPRWRAEEK